MSNPGVQQTKQRVTEHCNFHIVRQPRPQGAFPWLWGPQSQGKAPWGRGWLLGSASLNYMGFTTPFTELARRMPWVAHKICVVFRCVYMIRRAGPLAEISARATGFFCLTLLANQREKLPFFCKYLWKVNVCLDEWALAHTLPLSQSRQIFSVSRY